MAECSAGDNLGTNPEKDFSLNIREMLSGDINRLRYVQRFSMSHVVHRENVAEHSYYVCLYAWLIGKWANDYHGLPKSSGINLEGLLISALIHDLEECRTGDFSRIFKYSNPELTKMINLQSGEDLREVFETLWNGPHPREVQPMWRRWKHSKDISSPEGKILAFADFLAVLAYIVAEVNNFNPSMMQHYSTLAAYFKQFLDPEYDFLEPLISQTREIVSQMMEKLGKL